MTQDELMTILRYEPDTGKFFWLRCFRGIATGAQAGTLRNGRIAIGWSKKSYWAHRLAWLYVYGVWPTRLLDHINGDPTDNRIANLRECCQSENLQNLRAAKSHNKSGLLGVTWHKGVGKWRATIVVDRAQRHLGYFGDKSSAHEAYLSAKRQLHPFCNI